MDTHQVTNQPPPLVDNDLFGDHRALAEAVRRYVPAADRDALHRLGRLAGSEQAQRWAVEANANPPTLRTHDRYGHRVDEVDYHPSWHRLVEVAVTTGLAGAPWRPQPDDQALGDHVSRAAGFLVWSQLEAGQGCPVSMTYSATPALAADPALAEVWIPRLSSTRYDYGLRDPATKAGCLAGMGMTEKQGGSDVRTNSTRAEPSGGGNGEYLLTGHKWFCSAPMNDVFLVLAQAPDGLSCFLVPRVLPGGERNTFRLQRLKDKLGNRSSASSEVEFDRTLGWRLGPEGRGVAAIIEMVAATRLDCALGSAGLMRQALVQALHHASHRSAFGRLLVDQPLMANVLTDLAVESEAATVVSMRLAAAANRPDDEAERALRRIGLPLAKYWVTKRAVGHTAEALECLGGNGYVEESGLPRLFREAPLNAIWEGAGNVQALDVLRVLGREPHCLQAYLDEVGRARGADHRLDRATDQLLADLGELGEEDGETAGSARRLVERMALVLQASLLVRHAPHPVSDAFVAGRLTGGGLAYGTLPRGLDTKAVLARAAGHD